MPQQTNKEIVRRFLDGMWNYEKLQSLDQFLTPDYVMHGPTGDISGIRDYRESVSLELESMAGMFIRVDDLIAEGDRVVSRFATWFEHHGEFMGAFPTGRTIHMHNISIHRLVDGKIAESWETYDRRSLLRDRGLEQNLGEEDRFAIMAVIDDALRNGLHDKKRHGERYYAEHAEVVAAHGESMRGRAAIVAWLERFPPIADWKLTDVEIDGAGEVAYVRGHYTMNLSPRAKVPFDSGQYLEVWRKQADDTWKVIRHIFSSQVASRSRQKALAM